jgi:hypothetical protein
LRESGEEEECVCVRVVAALAAVLAVLLLPQVLQVLQAGVHQIHGMM